MNQPRFHEVTFTFDARVRELGITGMYFVMEGLTNQATNDEFDELLVHELEALDDSVSRGYDVKTDPILKGFRTLHAQLGLSNRNNVSSAENLLRMIRMNGSIPRVNLLVDICSLVSLRTRLAVGAHDLARIDGDIRLTLTTGRETYVPFGAPVPRPVGPGEYAYIDDSGAIICRLETRQVTKSKVDLSTTSCFFVVQGNPSTEADYVSRAGYELIALTKDFCGGTERMLYDPTTLP